ncbi:MAG: DUF3604 domain-containing protein [Phycisphaeraceae bacterium]|nr:DUF3604 domain-containing protein [Phycisphaeraceae bacterium]
MQYFVEPRSCPVDVPVTLRVTAILDAPLRRGDRIAFSLPESWSSRPYCITFTKPIHLDDPQAADHVTITADGAQFDLSLGRVAMPSGLPKGHVKKVIAVVREGEVQAGGHVHFTLSNSQSTWLAEDATIRVWINDQEEQNPPRVRTLPRDAEKIRLIAPSSARPGEPLRVRIVSLDRFWNRSSSKYQAGVLTREDGAVLMEGIDFVGSCEMEVVLHDPGVHRLMFDQARSNPIRICDDPHGPYWGDMHSHDKIHDCGAGEDAIGYARDVACLDFAAVMPDYRGLSLDTWPAFVARANRADDPGRFTSLLAYEVGFAAGHYNVYFRGAQGPLLDPADNTRRSLQHLLPLLDPADAFVVPHHVGVHWCPQASYAPEHDPWTVGLEIYSSHGLGERYMPEHVLAYEFNRVRGENKYASSVNKPVYARDAWAQGRRYGVVAGSDDHMGQPGKPVKGLTAAHATRNTRQDIWNALHTRHCYATTGERMLLDFHVNGQPMGSEIHANPGDTLRFTAEVHGTEDLAFIEIARLRLDGRGDWQSAYYKKLEDRDAFHEGKAQSNLDWSMSFEEPFDGDVMYYLRAGQRTMIDGWPAFAWSSPIWVTCGGPDT